MESTGPEENIQFALNDENMLLGMNFPTLVVRKSACISSGFYSSQILLRSKVEACILANASI